MNNKTLKQIKSWLSEGKAYRCYQLPQWRGKNGIRERAMKRDNYECQDCKRLGKQSRVDEVHHIVELKQRPELFLDLNNVVCLCKDCHNKRHRRELRGYTKRAEPLTPERW